MFFFLSFRFFFSLLEKKIRKNNKHKMKGKKLRIINSEFAETIKSKQLKGSN